MSPAHDHARPHFRTIAVVEDDKSLNLAVSRLLQAAGFRTHCFTSGAGLLGNALAYSVDCFVLDVHLPDMTGFELRTRLTLIGAVAPAIVITAHDDATHRRVAQDIGAFAYLSKPFSSLSLLDAVRRALISATPPDDP